MVIGMAADYSLETRIRRLLDGHREAGAEPRTLVMNAGTWRTLLAELDGYAYHDGYFWLPDHQMVGSPASAFLGVPILIKPFIADMEVIVGV